MNTSLRYSDFVNQRLDVERKHKIDKNINFSTSVTPCWRNFEIFHISQIAEYLKFKYIGNVPKICLELTTDFLSKILYTQQRSDRTILDNIYHRSTISQRSIASEVSQCLFRILPALARTVNSDCIFKFCETFYKGETLLKKKIIQDFLSY